MPPDQPWGEDPCRGSCWPAPSRSRPPSFAVTTAVGDHEPRYRALGDDATWTTVLDPTVGLEGLTSDRHGNLYTPGRGVAPCPILRTTPSGGAPVVVGNIDAPCNPTGLAFDRRGDLFIADGARIVTLRPSAASPPTATVYATDVPGANGVAFDRDGRLWVSDGATAQGRVWRIGSDRIPVEMFRVQPMANEAQPGGVGRDNRSLPPGTITITPTEPPGLQHARLAAPGGQRHRLRQRRRPARGRHRARGDLARRHRPQGPREEPDGLRHDVHVQHALPRQRARRAPVPRGRRRDRARSQGQHHRRRQRAQRDRRRHPATARSSCSATRSRRRSCATRARWSSRPAR